MPCGNESSINLAEPKDYMLDAECQIVRLTFDIKAIKLNITILDANTSFFTQKKIIKPS